LFVASRTKKDARTGGPLYNRVAVLRAERGLSRQELADAVGVNYQTIGYLERGDYKASLELAFRLTEFFKLPLSAIFSREPFQPMSEELYGTPAVSKKRQVARGQRVQARV
jgi:DNA-binding XRE family transcriptional regulator